MHYSLVFPLSKNLRFDTAGPRWRSTASVTIALLSLAVGTATSASAQAPTPTPTATPSPTPNVAVVDANGNVLNSGVSVANVPLLNAPSNSFTGELSGSRIGSDNTSHGEFHLGLDGADGWPSFLSQSTTSPQESFRLRMPKDPRTGPGHIANGPVDFYIAPYAFGMGIEFKGIVECWVEEWSIHNNNRGGGVIGNPARLWIGDNVDSGGAYISATSNADQTVQYTEIASQQFSKGSHGDLRLEVRDSKKDKIDFRFGPAGQETSKAAIYGTGNGRMAVGIVGAPQATLHIGDYGGSALRIQDTNGGTTSLQQVGSTFSLNTYNGSGQYKATPLSIDVNSAGIIAPGTATFGGTVTSAKNIVTNSTSAAVDMIAAGSDGHDWLLQTANGAVFNTSPGRFRIFDNTVRAERFSIGTGGAASFMNNPVSMGPLTVSGTASFSGAVTMTSVQTQGGANFGGTVSSSALSTGTVNATSLSAGPITSTGALAGYTIGDQTGGSTWQLASSSGTISLGNSATPGVAEMTLSQAGDASFAGNVLPVTNGGGSLGNQSNKWKQLYINQVLTPAGSTGAATINTAAGTVRLAPGDTTVTVTDSMCTANSLVFAVVRTNDATAFVKNVVPTNGSFTINLGSAATAETEVAFHIINQ